MVGHPPEHATKTPVATKATKQRRQTRASPRPAFPSEGHGARNCLHPDPCSVRSRQSPHHASVRKGGHQIHILRVENLTRRLHSDPCSVRSHQSPDQFGRAAIDSHPGGWKIPPKTHNHEDELRRVSSKLQGRFLTKLRIAGRFGRLSVITQEPSRQKVT